jgi:hypothetical protein
VSSEQPGAEQPASIEQDQPLLKVVAGQPSDDELAALTAVVLALAGDGSSEAPSRPGGWSDLSLRLRRPLPPGPNAWRDSRWL